MAPQTSSQQVLSLLNGGAVKGPSLGRRFTLGRREGPDGLLVILTTRGPKGGWDVVGTGDGVLQQGGGRGWGGVTHQGL